MHKTIHIFFAASLFTILAHADGVDGIFMVVKGQISVKSKSAAQVVPAKIGSKVHEGDEIVSGPDSRAKIVMADKNVFNISPDSKVMIEKYRNEAKEKNVEIKVESGKLRSSLEQKYDGEKSQFNIKTPSAVAGVRGTDFVTSYNSQTRETTISTFHGTVAVASVGPSGKISSPVMVKANQTSSVKSGGQPDAPKSIPQQKMQQMNQETSAANNPSTSTGNSSNSANNSSNSSTSGSRDPASTSANSTSSSTPSNSAAGTTSGTGSSAAASTVTAASPSMLSTQDLGTSAAASISPASQPPGAGLGATPIAVLPPTTANSGFLQNVSGAAGGSAHVQISLTPH